MDRRDTINGIDGGLLVYVKEGLLIKPVELNCDFNQFAQFEVMNIDDKSANLNITLIYRPPGSNIVKHWRTMQIN